MTDRELILEAIEARKMSYSPYSHFMVGAALLTKDGRVYRGCNIENAAYGPSNCAERTAFFKAISEGVRDFDTIAIVGGDKDAKPEEMSFAYPCGVCRQVMIEFCKPEEFRVIVAKNTDEYKVYTLGEILPMGFGPADLGVNKK